MPANTSSSASAATDDEVRALRIVTLGDRGVAVPEQIACDLDTGRVRYRRSDGLAEAEVLGIDPAPPSVTPDKTDRGSSCEPSSRRPKRAPLSSGFHPAAPPSDLMTVGEPLRAVRMRSTLLKHLGTPHLKSSCSVGDTRPLTSDLLIAPGRMVSLLNVCEADMLAMVAFWITHSRSSPQSIHRSPDAPLVKTIAHNHDCQQIQRS